ncbi:mechanosensitive ion channel domain-containing protein [Dysgonomonas sp. 520]|uniref:mechanosensitive ion channel domain-containing protein n=1 Tax=Dysgonomonas sp. 520 TaxID=2302931 RepID=UPI0013D17E36|nr:mechanosensitive ion channel domain-containing protein [Dysgonomonas sp. 520]NDW09466.1 mechanosensitive ion channel family protein [Dysgonomonas sp. 520]
MIEQYLIQIIVTGILFLMMPSMKFVARKLIRKYARINKRLESRTNQIIHIIQILINLTCVIAIIIIWGVDPKNIFLALSSIFAIIGVAMFAQWSMLSNITAGLIIFFTSPFRIGDRIRIHDNDTPEDAEITDIRTFHTYLRTDEGESVIYPNSLFLQKAVSVGEPLRSKKKGEDENFEFKE